MRCVASLCGSTHVPVAVRPHLLRALMEFALCGGPEVTSSVVNSLYPSAVAQTLHSLDGSGGSSAFASLLPVMGETRLTQLGTALVDHYVSQGFGTVTSTVGMLLMLRDDAPVACQRAVWQDVVSSGLGRRVTLPPGAVVALVIASLFPVIRFHA